MSINITERALANLQREQAEAGVILEDNAQKLALAQEAIDKSLEELSELNDRTKLLKEKVSKTKESIAHMQSTLAIIMGIFIAVLVGTGLGLKGVPLAGCAIVGGVAGYLLNPLLTKLVHYLR